MVSYIRSDLEFILAQIKIAEAHAAGQPLYGPGGLIPTYNLAWGLRTVDGSYNNLLNPNWGSSDEPFREGLGTDFRTLFVDADPGPGVQMTQVTYTPGVDVDGPTMTLPDGTVIGNRAGPGDVIDPEVRIISNLIVDQTLGNPSAILTALQRAGVDDPGLVITGTISDAYAPLQPLFEALGDAQRAYANASAAAAASPNNAALQTAAANAAAAVELARTTLETDPGYTTLTTLLDDNGIELDGTNLRITNSAPDEGLSAPFNSWFTLFGQFFDHGLDLVGKGGSGTVMIPLMPDDPLYVPGSSTNFMVLTRATVGPGADGILVDNPNTAVDESADNVRPINTTTSFVDQNQTYTSHPSHQVFLREYVMANGRPVATGELIQGQQGGMATWADLKAQAADLLGIQLLDSDVGNVPLLLTDPYGEFIRGPNGFVQIMTTTGLVEADPAANGGLGTLLPANTLRTGHAFLADIAHSAVPGGLADGDIEIGLDNPGNLPGVYDDELLNAHYVAGDGRANENIGLTAVHHVFHAEHNRLVEHTKAVTIADAAAMLAGGATQAEAVAFLNEWLIDDVTAVPADQAAINALVWDGERLFQAAKFGTEMQYQHLVFEEFARKIQPNINVFLVPDGFDVTIDPSIVAEFAHVVYRFGHSMLTETIDRFDPSFTPDQIGLIEGFLNPVQFTNNGGNNPIDAEVAAGAIIRGMTRQAGNEIDEFVTSALRNNLLGLPLDLATINLARGRDTGVPTLNEARAQFYEATDENSLLKPYESWVDFAGNLKHEASIINFIAAYGTHSTLTSATTLEEKRAAAMALVGLGGGTLDEADRLAFLNGTGIYAGDLGGLNKVDLWIGGLAEKIMPFGGMLGSTFNFVFETQMESLQNGDRFYYLQRLDGLHLFSEMEGNSFAGMIMRNTNATHLPSDVFSTPGLILEIDRTRQYNPGLGETAGADGILEDDPTTAVNEAADNIGNDPTGGSILTPLVIRDNPQTPTLDTNYLRYTGDEHVLLGGTDAADVLIASIGDDTLFGDGGNDRLEGGFGNDIINGGAGDDIIRDAGGDDNIKANEGNDVVHAGPGLDLVLGGDGQDFIVLGTDMGSEVFGGTGNDFILGNKNAERILGNEGDDWLETGTFDGAPGDNFDEIFARDGIRGNDVFLGDGGFDEFIGEGGDDIFVGSPGRGKMAGMSGFDWATYQENSAFVNADLSVPIVFDEAPTLPQNTALDEFESVNGLSGTRFNDILAGSNEDAASLLPLAQGGGTGFLGSALDAQGIALINGLQGVVGAGVTSFAAGDIILGGDGSDTIKGNAGDDIIDGDKWLNVRISIRQNVGPNGGTGPEIASASRMTANVTLNGVTKPLTAWMLEGAINPGQLTIVREILTDTTSGDIDTAVYSEVMANYSFATGADGTLRVSHTGGANPIEGTDSLRNIERLQFSDATVGVVVGTPFSDNGVAPQGPPSDNRPVINGTAGNELILGLAGADVLNGFAGNDILVGGPGASVALSSYGDNFNSSSFGNTDGSANWGPDWIETADNNSTTTGQIQIDGNAANNASNNVLAFLAGDGAQIQRTLDLSNATAPTLNYTVTRNGLDGGADNDNVTVFFSRDGSNFVQVDIISSTSTITPRAIDLTQFGTGPFTANAAIRFVASSLETGESVTIDNLAVNFTVPAVNGGVDTLNGGLGNDIYSFSLGDGNDVINEAVNATSGGTADLISILAPTTGIDPLTDEPILTLTGLNAFDDNTNSATGNLVINYTMPSGATNVTQTITVNGQYTGNNAQTGVERINFNNATYEGYLLGAADYLVNRADGGGNRTIDLTASTANNFIAGENGTNDDITGGLGNDLIFGGTGDNVLDGGDGDDLIVGGSGAGDNDVIDGGLGIDTMIGLAGNDTYIVDDLEDVVVEAAGAGTDTVETLMAALSIEAMANVENLTYTGLDADQFVGTGNAGNNIISGGDLADTLSGLGGNDTLNGGIGTDTLIGGAGTDTLNGGTEADNMQGGADNDTYIVDDAGDVVTELAGGGTADVVNASITYTLGAEVENLTLTGAAAINGSGNGLANVITGNGSNNQLFGGGGGDTIDGGNGNDLIDGGQGDDTLSGGIGNDVDNIIGGTGNDTINLLANDGGNDVLIYNALGFGDDIVNNFDATGGTAATQDLIDLSTFGITAVNFATRVGIAAVGGANNTLLTVRDAGGATIGTIRINGIAPANITTSDFILATATNTINGTAAGTTIPGTAGADTINALAGNDTVNAGAGNDIINGGTGNDTLNGQDGDDTFNWNANPPPPPAGNVTDGRDVIDGGNEGAVGDTFVISGNTTAEIYRIYTRAAFDAVAGNNLNGINAATEIIITRNGTNAASIIAELRDIEEIRINNVEPVVNGAAGNDTFQIIGDFSGTSLRLNTITIDGDLGDDTIDISALTSAHRIVFRSNGGNDTIVGTLRPQDVIELPDGKTAADYTTTTENGVTTMTCGEHSITFTASGGMPQVGGEDDTPAGDDNEQDGDDTPAPATEATTGPAMVGTANADVLLGTANGETIIALGGNDTAIGGGGADIMRGEDGDDFMSAEGGNDIVFGGMGNDDLLGGAGNDMLYGDAGSDRIFGDAGNDLIHTGAGNDTAYGGEGDDLFVAEAGDGDDTYYGDAGSDTLDMAAITANLTVDLGNGFMGRGSVSSSQSGSDMVWNVENVVTGSGADTITASRAANVIDGGAGSDTFRFLSEADADGDTIVSFQPGDKIDFSGIDANGGASGNQSFTLVAASTLSSAAQLIVTHETREDGDYTVVQANVDDDNAAELRLSIKGTHNLTSTDFNL
ncbi:hypothetical protein AS026_32535 [Rhizobium altiplani]|uniref:Heme peroxidase n=1 Tax=Rhizobium altiplani TaxID=1864509 RepID=A0A109JXN5_9HYPH|nr:peroxidase family protein [Rhizobium altiplani]KWV56940.1 hypothetical protein AS026_32535 [Rhizobium altiplani]